MYDYLIVGSGIFGAVFAHEVRKSGKTCLVIDKRTHIAGNIYTSLEEGIHVHKYGAHIFHTNIKEVWDYVSEFAEFNRYTNSPVANYKGEIYNLPFNMNTFNKMWGVITPAEAKAKIDEQKKNALSSLADVLPSDDKKTVDKKIAAFVPSNLEEQAISLIGTDIYEKLINGYTGKQWGRSCKELPPFIIKRLPVRFTYDNNYFNALYQGIPVGGYTKMVQNILGDTPVCLGVDYLSEKKTFAETGHLTKLESYRDPEHALDDPSCLGIAKKVVYTGPIDAFFGYNLGALKYRSVRFETETLDIDNYQGNAVVNYTDAETLFTRIIEHKHFEFAQRYNEDGTPLNESLAEPKTIISREYSAEWKVGDEPYYPVNDEENGKLYLQYKELAAKEYHVLFGGRLGEYKYYDMDQVIAQALQTSKKELN